MASQDERRLPASLGEVEALVLQLYQPGAHENVTGIQEALQKLQRSSEGWQLANSLLGNGNESVRFFGALTFIVKLNTDTKSLSGDDSQAVLQNIIGWLIQCLGNGEGALVVRKLCSTLVAYFLQFSATWTRCVRHILYCLRMNRAVSYESLEEAPDNATLIQNLSNEQAVVVFWFAGALVEEVGKTDSNSMKQHKFHRDTIPNAEDIVPLIAKYITDPSGGTPYNAKVRLEAMSCFQAWVSYSQRAFIDAEIILEPLQTLTRYAIMCLADENLCEITMELISDVLSNYSKFLKKDDFSLLYSLFGSPWAQERYQRLIGGDYEFESFQFGQFMVAFGDATVQDLAQNIDTDPQCLQLLSALSGLLNGEGYAVCEDKMFVPALEFWNTFVEFVTDSMHSADTEQLPSWFPAAKAQVLQVIHHCWRKIQFPKLAEFSSWDSVDRTGFKDARRDVLDLVEGSYVMMGIPMLAIFIDLAQKAIENGNWSELEASLHLMLTFPDCIWEDPERDAYLTRIFNYSLFDLFASHGINVPFRAMQTFLGIVQAYAEYFSQYTEHLPKVLNISFNATNVPSLAKTASQTIVRLCGDCRTALVPELGTFIHHLSSTIHSSFDARVKEGTAQGIASLIQALPDDESKLEPLNELLNYIEVDVESCLRLLSPSLPIDLASNINTSDKNLSNDYTMALELAVRVLRCLEGVAKGLQQPKDQPLDLDGEISAFWITGHGSIVQQRITSIMTRTYEPLLNRSEIVEGACSVYRAGFVEPSGPFVFSPNIVAQFLLKADFQTPRLGLIINTACSFISSNKRGPEVESTIDTLIKWIALLLERLADPSQDPEIAQSGIDLLYRLFPTYFDVFLNQPATSVEYLFTFTIKALAGNNPLPKTAAADFWSNFVSIPNEKAPSPDTIDSLMGHLGPLLAQVLVHNIGGNAARSELDKISEPIKKLVVRHLHSKNWFEAALMSQNFPSDKVTIKDKQIFLQKIINLRGARGTNQVVRDFWLACRRSNFAYAS